jgi:hypothetical protein
MPYLRSHYEPQNELEEKGWSKGQGAMQ